MWENTTPSIEFPMTFVLGSARCSSALCLFFVFLHHGDVIKFGNTCMWTSVTPTSSHYNRWFWLSHSVLTFLTFLYIRAVESRCPGYRIRDGWGWVGGGGWGDGRGRGGIRWSLNAPRTHANAHMHKKYKICYHLFQFIFDSITNLFCFLPQVSNK